MPLYPGAVETTTFRLRHLVAQSPVLFPWLILIHFPARSSVPAVPPRVFRLLRRVPSAENQYPMDICWNIWRYGRPGGDRQPRCNGHEGVHLRVLDCGEEYCWAGALLAQLPAIRLELQRAGIARMFRPGHHKACQDSELWCPWAK
jgi:hypothetical protein